MSKAARWDRSSTAISVTTKPPEKMSWISILPESIMLNHSLATSVTTKLPLQSGLKATRRNLTRPRNPPPQSTNVLGVITDPKENLMLLGMSSVARSWKRPPRFLYQSQCTLSRRLAVLLQQHQEGMYYCHAIGRPTGPNVLRSFIVSVQNSWKLLPDF